MTIPPLRVSPELRRQAEAVLAQGETLSGLVLDALTRSIEYRKTDTNSSPAGWRVPPKLRRPANMSRPTG
ncbi:MAG TPA: YlcI/YnfO family protein [Casimicrobiaceae bacterium]